MDPSESVHEQYQWMEVVLDYFVSTCFTTATLPHWYATAMCLKQYTLGDPHYPHSQVPFIIQCTIYSHVDGVCGERVGN